jgi:hypothetical protein
MEKPVLYSLPCGSCGTLESLKVTELGHVMARFRIEEDGHSRWINYGVAMVDDLLATKKIFNTKSWNNEEVTRV